MTTSAPIDLARISDCPITRTVLPHADPTRLRGVLHVAPHLKPKVRPHIKPALSECEHIGRLVYAADGQFAGWDVATAPFWQLHIFPVAGEA